MSGGWWYLMGRGSIGPKQGCLVGRGIWWEGGSVVAETGVSCR